MTNLSAYASTLSQAQTECLSPWTLSARPTEGNICGGGWGSLGAGACSGRLHPPLQSKGGVPLVVPQNQKADGIAFFFVKKVVGK